jgi:hypothetical protein
VQEWLSTGLEWLSTSAYAEWVNESWGWPFALTIHAFGVAVIVGFMAIIGLRLLGLFRTMSFTSLRTLIPYIWVAYFFQAVSGFTLWMTKPDRYLKDGMFEVKFTLVVVAGIVMVIFSLILRREAADWDASGKVSPRGRKYVIASFLLWCGVTIAGRLTAYLGSLYLQ